MHHILYVDTVWHTRPLLLDYYFTDQPIPVFWRKQKIWKQKKIEKSLEGFFFLNLFSICFSKIKINWGTNLMIWIILYLPLQIECEILCNEWPLACTLVLRYVPSVFIMSTCRTLALHVNIIVWVALPHVLNFLCVYMNNVCMYIPYGQLDLEIPIMIRKYAV